MPRYAYKCNVCEERFTVTHRYKEKGIVCIKCQSGDISKDLSIPIKSRQRTFTDKDKNVGDEVKAAIKDGQEDLKRSKKTITKRVYKK